MRMLDDIIVAHPAGSRKIELFAGDLTAIPAEYAVDALVVSAFMSNYNPTPRSLIGALSRTGIDVAALAQNKEFDLRETSCCWLSRPLQRPGFHAGRILGFEASHRGRPPEMVGDIFRSLMPWSTGEPWVRRIAMPLLASGSQREDPKIMLRAIVEAAKKWLSAGLPIERLGIVLLDSHPREYLDGLAEVFAETKEIAEAHWSSMGTDYDLFISYSHQDAQHVHTLVKLIRTEAPDLRIFVDAAELDAGSAWQQKIFEAIDGAGQIVCLYSPDYLTSKPCVEELNIALLRNREEGGVLFPAYLRSAELPSYLRAVQYHDVREGSLDRLRELAKKITATRRSVPHSDPPSTDGSPVESVTTTLSQHGLELDITLKIRVRPVDTA